MSGERVEALCDLGLCEVAGAIARREVTSVAATAACLARIRRLADHLNCFLAVEADAALEAAERADAALARGSPLGPLHGVPLAHKDLFYRAGHTVTCGSRIRKDFVPSVTATVIERLEQAGAVTLGALTLAEFAMGPTGWNEHFGPTRNPWSLDHVSGGSSSGSAAAVAARLAFGSLGTDTGGSIRVPAAFCGVVGLKPTQSRVSRFGVMPLAHSLDCVSPLARTARDCARLLSVIAGKDPLDPTASSGPVPGYEARLDGDIRGLRVAVPRALHDEVTDEDIRRALTASLDVLRDLGAVIVEVPAPDLPLLNTLSGVVFLCEAATIHGNWLRTRREDYGPQVFERLTTGLLYPATRYLEALSLRGRLLTEFVSRVLGEADLLHLPAVPTTAPTVTEASTRDVAAALTHNARLTPFTPFANYLGLPVIAVPAGFAGGSLPVGFQLMARPFAEGLLLKVADTYQRATDWHAKNPPIH
jgi:aspartyl-tRNA(Asn)/glutamyl-tRNA(Gln) amidotransferase subunit A